MGNEKIKADQRISQLEDQLKRSKTNSEVQKESVKEKDDQREEVDLITVIQISDQSSAFQEIEALKARVSQFQRRNEMIKQVLESDSYRSVGIVKPKAESGPSILSPSSTSQT